jgi:hypothetical protein
MIMNHPKMYTKTFLQHPIHDRTEVYRSLLTNPLQQRYHSSLLPYLPETHKKRYKKYQEEGQ